MLSLSKCFLRKAEIISHSDQLEHHVKVGKKKWKCNKIIENVSVVNIDKF